MTQYAENDILISGTGLYTPPESISNDELVASFNTFVDSYNATHRKTIEAGQREPLQHSSVAFIEKASGIKSRYVMEKNGILDPQRMCPRIPDRPDTEPSLQCDMSVAAINAALEQANKKPADVDAIIASCANFQRAYPAMSIEIQSALGIEGFAFDMNVACSAATFAIQTAVDAVRSGSADCVVMVNPEINTGHLNFQDRDSHFIFGDVCTAMVIERAAVCKAPSAFRILGTKLITRFSNNVRNNFGFLNRADEDGIGKPDKLFKQNGTKVFKEVIPITSGLIISHLEELGVPVDAAKRLWLHQANINMNNYVAEKVLGRRATLEEAPLVLDEFGNTASAGSIIAFHRYNQDLTNGDIGVICSFGAGYSAGSVVVQKVVPE
ncbi:MAG: 3-oxoacyl-[acyl-carrier-protein] synthase, KASIII (EC 2.3.1.180) [Olavius algarvensis Delta 4 endosymbiont]|nr:MAG: 3-oxoacyl-[acyl-carrier-protein] synthase, KASIII (EC 2.3.1.180) [Olavius algarvensis Delta 4 endosymbiont]